jgi:hypothetical protein
VSESTLGRTATRRVPVATLGLLDTWMRLQAMQPADGLAPVERGFQRWRPALQPGVRTLAVIGFCCAGTILVYHLPFNWLGIVGTSTAHLADLHVARVSRHGMV